MVLSSVLGMGCQQPEDALGGGGPRSSQGGTGPGHGGAGRCNNPRGEVREESVLLKSRTFSHEEATGW